jgi:uncharacterized repeat protein (TIGR03803 family)
MRSHSNIAGWSFLTVLATLVPLDVAAGNEKVIYSFTGGTTDGSVPNSRLAMDNDGNFYGTTFAGGDDDDGTVFRVTPHGRESILHSFTGGSDGGFPTGDLIVGFDGNLYGTTEGGGDSGFGTVFQLTLTGEETVLYSFTGGSDGGNPLGGVIMDGDGNLYGTTKNGGAGLLGTVFKLTPGKEKVLHSFTTGGDGANPHGGLIMDGDGNLYGTTTDGGALNQGTAFKLKPNGKETILHSFDGGNDGAFPISALVMDGDGNLYGTTPSGGVSLAGTAFKLKPNGKIKVLHSFTGGDDGSTPAGSLIMDVTGDLYGATAAGGAGGASVGTVFRLSPRGKETVLHSFDADIDINDGRAPASALTMDFAGDLYGVTSQGGSRNVGTVFRVRN